MDQLDQPTTVLRTQKNHNWNQLTTAAAHNSRKNMPENADPERSHLNRCLIGGPDDDVVEIAKTRINPGRKIRADNVLGVTGIMSASPSYFRPTNPEAAGAYDPARLEPWVMASMAWLKQHYGDRRLIQAILHLDEVTPHIHFILVPIDERGHLNCKALQGAPKLMSDMQTGYWEAVKHLGIAHPQKGSKADHMTVKQFYGLITQATAPNLPAADEFTQDPPALLRTRQNIKAWAAKEKETQTEEVKIYFQALIAKSVLAERKAKEAERQAERERQKSAKLKVEAERAEADQIRAKQITDAMRDLDLALILQDMFQAEAIGPDSKGWERYRLPDGEVVSVSGSAWKADQAKGKGAINLMMELAGYEQNEFKQAVRDLAEVYGNEATSRALAGHQVRTAPDQVRTITQTMAPTPGASRAAERRFLALEQAAADKKKKKRRPKMNQRPVAAPSM